MPVFVADPDAFDKLTAVEGKRWAKLTYDALLAYQGFSVPLPRENFFYVKRAYCEAVCELKRSGQPVVREVELMDNNVVYGEGGYARYIVRNGGEIVLDGRSTREERAKKAEAVGFTVLR